MLRLSVVLSSLILGAVLGLPPASASAPIQLAQGAMIDGEVRKVDMSAGKITIRHGAIPKYDMATPMTMVFPARDPSMLNGLAAGDKAVFDVEKEGGSLTIIQIRKAN